MVEEQLSLSDFHFSIFNVPLSSWRNLLKFIAIISEVVNMCKDSIELVNKWPDSFHLKSYMFQEKLRNMFLELHLRLCHDLELISTEGKDSSLFLSYLFNSLQDQTHSTVVLSLMQRELRRWIGFRRKAMTEAWLIVCWLRHERHRNRHLPLNTKAAESWRGWRSWQEDLAHRQCGIWRKLCHPNLVILR